MRKHAASAQIRGILPTPGWQTSRTGHDVKWRGDRLCQQSLGSLMHMKDSASFTFGETRICSACPHAAQRRLWDSMPCDSLAVSTNDAGAYEVNTVS
jgi:hypothetical protein